MNGAVRSNALRRENSSSFCRSFPAHMHLAAIVWHLWSGAWEQLCIRGVNKFNMPTRPFMAVFAPYPDICPVPSALFLHKTSFRNVSLAAQSQNRI